MQAPVLEHFLDAFGPLCRDSQNPVWQWEVFTEVSTRVDRFDPLNFFDRVTPVWEGILCRSASCVGLCRYIKYVYVYKLHEGLV